MRSNMLESISIDRRSAIGYDQQVKESIKSLILDQSFYYQSVLPNPEEIAEFLHIDKKYVQKAFDSLSSERYIKKNDKNDYEVAYFELTNYFFYRNVAIYDAIKALGMTPSIECLEKKIVKLPEKRLYEMGFKKGEKLFYINRIYKGNQKPIIMLENYLPLSILKDFDQRFIGTEPLNAYLEKEYQIKAKLSHRVTKAVNLSQELADILGERKHAASIQSTNKVYDQFNRLIDFGQSHTTSNYYFQALISHDELAHYYTEIHPKEQKDIK